MMLNASAQSIDCGYSLEPPREVIEYTQSMFLCTNKKKIM